MAQRCYGRTVTLSRLRDDRGPRDEGGGRPVGQPTGRLGRGGADAGGGGGGGWTQPRVGGRWGGGGGRNRSVAARPRRATEEAHRAGKTIASGVSGSQRLLAEWAARAMTPRAMTMCSRT